MMILFKNRGVLEFPGRTFALCHLALGLVAMAGCSSPADDVKFARRSLTYLVRGWYMARPMLDWQSLKMLEHDVAAEHERLPDAKEKAEYERKFIDGFKEGFKTRNVRLSAFFDWRVYDASDPTTTIVAANCFDKGKVFLFFVKHEKGKRKLVEVKALNIYDQENFYGQEKERRRR